MRKSGSRARGGDAAIGARTAILIAGTDCMQRAARRAYRIGNGRPKLLAPTYYSVQRGAGLPGSIACSMCSKRESSSSGISAADSGGAQASVAYFAYPGKSSVFTSPNVRSTRWRSWRRLRWRGSTRWRSFVGTRRRSHRGTGEAADDASGRLPCGTGRRWELCCRELYVVDESMTRAAD